MSVHYQTQISKNKVHFNYSSQHAAGLQYSCEFSDLRIMLVQELPNFHIY